MIINPQAFSYLLPLNGRLVATDRAHRLELALLAHRPLGQLPQGQVQAVPVVRVVFQSISGKIERSFLSMTEREIPHGWLISICGSIRSRRINQGKKQGFELPRYAAAMQIPSVFLCFIPWCVKIQDQDRGRRRRSAPPFFSTLSKLWQRLQTNFPDLELFCHHHHHKPKVLPDSDALGFQVVPSLIHLVQSLLERGGIFGSVQVRQQLLATRSQGHKVLPLAVEFTLQVLQGQ